METSCFSLSTRAVETDDNNGIYIASSYLYDTAKSSLIKYDSNLNQLWEIVVGDNGNGNTNAYLIDIE